MGGKIAYQGVEAYYNIIIEHPSENPPGSVPRFGYILTFESIDDLESLLSMKANQIVTLDEGKRVRVSTFRQDMLNQTFKICTTKSRAYELTTEYLFQTQDRDFLKKVAESFFSDPRVQGTIEYHHKVIAKYHRLVPSHPFPKYNLFFDNLKDLELLLSLSPAEDIHISDQAWRFKSCSIPAFRDRVLGQLLRMYILSNNISSSMEVDRELDIAYLMFDPFLSKLLRMQKLL